MACTPAKALLGLTAFAVACRLAVGHPQYWDGCGHPDRDNLAGHARVLPSRCDTLLFSTPPGALRPECVLRIDKSTRELSVTLVSITPHYVSVLSFRARSETVFTLLEGGSRGKPVTVYEAGVEYTIRVRTFTIGKRRGLGGRCTARFILLHVSCKGWR